MIFTQRILVPIKICETLPEEEKLEDYTAAAGQDGRGEARRLSGDASCFPTIGPRFKPRVGQGRLSFTPFRVSINEFQACLGT
ncbi:hypothetical protein TNCV_5142071 [Trichonephila clavipes]|nr:hypothetical protein TNCV_5142071 [Trichonephila clavipes]